MRTIAFEQTAPKDDWLDHVTEDQRVDLKQFKGQDIEILKGFIYASEKWARDGFTFLFKDEEGKELYTTTFGTAIVRQAKEILPVLKEDSVAVHVSEATSKQFKKPYLFFTSVEGLGGQN